MRTKQAYPRIIGGSTPSSAEPTYWDGDLVWVTPADVSQAERLRTSQRRITREGLDSCSSEMVPAGSLIVTSRAPVGNVAIADVNLCTNQGCKALVAAHGVVNPEFGLAVLKTLKPELQSLATGTTFTEISTSRLGTVPIPLPPPDEQAFIVRFLDHADRRIRRYIRAKQKLIGFLEEQKQAIIHRAVTRGLSRERADRRSVRLKRVAIVQTGITLGKDYGDAMLAERPYLRVANVQAGHLDLATVKTVRVPVQEASGSTLRPGDVLMTEGGDIDKLGRGCIWLGEIPDCVHQNHVFAVRPRPTNLLPEFLVLLMASQHGRAYFQRTAKQTTNLAATNSTTLGNFPLLLPSIAEQARIVAVEIEQSTAIHKAMDSARREIRLMAEYRTRLIADVVTGKIDVREVAARLPVRSRSLSTRLTPSSTTREPSVTILMLKSSSSHEH